MVSAPLRDDRASLGLDGSPEAGRARDIVAAAYDLLDEAGLEGLTIRAVLARTGLARRAFYECFSGKDDLVLAVFEHAIRLAAAYYREQASTLADPMARLRLIVTSIGLARGNIAEAVREGDASSGGRRNNKRGAALSREHLRLAETRPRELQAALAPLRALISELLRDGIAAGQVRECDADLQAALIYNLISTTVHTELLAEEGASFGPGRRLQRAGELWDFCWRAIRV